MKHFILIVVLFILSCSICSANFSFSQAIHQAEQFISLVDNQDYQAAYNSASDIFKISTLEQGWIVERGRSDELLGHVLDRQLISVKARDSYPGLPDGDYLLVYFETRTERKAKAAEVLLLTKESDRWAVCSYRLK